MRVIAQPRGSTKAPEALGNGLKGETSATTPVKPETTTTAPIPDGNVIDAESNGNKLSDHQQQPLEI